MKTKSLKRSKRNRKRMAQQRRLHKPALQAGFTLIEMLVATALMIVIMTLFAETFGIASEMISKQKGVARNDQHARTFTSIVRTDIERRTFRDVIPFYPGQRTDSGAPSPPGANYFEERRRGFFSISENDPDDQTDDVLHLTVDITQDLANPDLHPLTGRAVLLTDGTTTSPEEERAFLFLNPDQPEFDDGQVELETVATAANVGTITGSLNFAGSSRAAEVVYFLRNGNLYRRVLLIREPYDEESGGEAGQPKDSSSAAYYTGTPADYSASATPNGSGEFWRDFAYSAFYEQAEDGSTPSPSGLKFHFYPTSLINENVGVATAPSSTTEMPYSLGVPHLRFGHSRRIASGVPAEYINAGADFIGRFTARETAHSDFGYPGRIPAGGDPHIDATLSLVAGEVSDFSDEDFLVDEDLLMTNVHEFDVKVWEDNFLGFRDVGHSEAGGYYGSAQSANTDFPNTYDTWHPYDYSSETKQNLGTPPFRPNQVGPDAVDEALTDELGTDDEIPLRGISVRVRYLDTQSNQMRQVTLNLSLID